MLPCDVARDEEIEVLFGRLRQEWDGLDGIVHSIAFAPREALKGELLDDLTRDAFRIAHDVSSYSFAALAKAGLPMMQGRPAALLTLTYLGAMRSVPSYNVMGMAKASLEAGVRYLALGLGPRGIRVNGISAGPVKTLAAAGISGFGRILKFVEENAPLRRNVTTRGYRERRGVPAERSRGRRHRRDPARRLRLQYDDRGDEARIARKA